MTPPLVSVVRPACYRNDRLRDAATFLAVDLDGSWGPDPTQGIESTRGECVQILGDDEPVGDRFRGG